jgi:hypothetical protein
MVAGFKFSESVFRIQSFSRFQNLVFHSNRIIQTRIFVRLYDTRRGLRRRCARGTRRRDASATKAPAAPAFPAVVAAAAPAAASPPRGQAASASAPKIQTSIFCTGQILKKSRSTRMPASTDFQKFYSRCELHFSRPHLEKRSSNVRKKWRKSRRKNFAPFRHSGTKNRVIGLENFSVEWV